MTPNQPIHTLSLQGMAQAPRFDRCCTLSRFPRELDFDCTPGSGKVNPGSAFHRSSFDVCRESYRQLSLGSHNRPMGLKFPVFVKRRDKSGEVVNTICQTADHVLRKIDELRRCSEVWIEDVAGYLIDEKNFGPVS